MKKIYKKIIILTLAFTLILTIIPTSYASSIALPSGKNYIDPAIVSADENNFGINESIFVNAWSYYVFSFKTVEDPYVVLQGNYFTISVTGNNGAIYQHTVNSGSMGECSISAPYTISCLLETGSSTLITQISMYASDVLFSEVGNEYQLEDGEDFTSFEVYQAPVFDTTAPVINGGTGVIITNVNDPISTSSIMSGISALDETDGVVTVVKFSDTYTGNENVLGDHTIVLRATDLSGNMTEFTTIIRVVDITAPIITLTGSSIVYLEYGGDQYNELGATVSDNFDTGLTVSIPNVSFIDYDTLGTYYGSYTASDNSGNTAISKTRTVIVRDTRSPIQTLTGSSTIYVEYGNSYVELGATWTDTYDGSGASVKTGTVNVDVLGTYTISYDKTDSNDNVADTLTRTVIVRDTTKPLQTLTGSSTIYVEYGNSYTELGATWTDGFDGSGNSVTTGTVNVGVLGTYTVTYTKTDSSGNVATSLTRTVIVRDTTKPVVTLNGSSTIYVEYGNSYTDLGASVLDNFDGVDSADYGSTVNVGILGTYTVTYRYTDSNGNESIDVTRTVIVRDITKPIQILTGSSIVYLEIGSDQYEELGATWTDAFDGSGISTVSGTVNDDLVGSYTVTYNKTDTNGNIAVTLTRTVIVQDTRAPIQTLNGLSIVYVEFGSNYTELNASWTDYSDGSGNSIITGEVNVGVLGTYELTYNVTDSLGNIADTLTRTVIVRDTLDPVFSGISNYSISTLSVFDLSTVINDVTASDLFSGDLTSSIIVVSDNFTGNENIVGNYSIILRVSDSSLNTIDLTVNVAVSDNAAPVFSSTIEFLTVAYADSMSQQDIIDYLNNQ